MINRATKKKRILKALCLFLVLFHVRNSFATETGLETRTYEQLKYIYNTVLQEMKSRPEWAEDPVNDIISDQSISPISYDRMSTQELYEKKGEIEQELLLRNMDDVTTLPAGVYNVGKDIAEGKYKLRIYTKDPVPTSPSSYTSIYLWPVTTVVWEAVGRETVPTQKDYFHEEFHGNAEVVLNLEKDQCLDVDIYGECMIVIEKASALFLE